MGEPVGLLNFHTPRGADACRAAGDLIHDLLRIGHADFPQHAAERGVFNLEVAEQITGRRHDDDTAVDLGEYYLSVMQVRPVGFRGWSL